MSITVSLQAFAGLVTLMTAVWGVSVARRDVSIVDLFWGVGFLVATWIYLAAGALTGRTLLVTLLVHVWGLRLSLHLWRRNRGRPEDRRYRAMRERWGDGFAWQSLVVVFWLQAALAWVISFPLQAALASGRDALAGIEWAGLALFAVGLTFEAVGDRQLARFRSDPANRHAVCDRGLWRYTRHPNYFGEAVLWWGLGLFALATPGAGWTLVGPALLTTLLLRVSGVSLLEPDLRQRKPGYAAYVARTSAFVPWPPAPTGHAPDRPPRPRGR